jgi:hypothetical protein
MLPIIVHFRVISQTVKDSFVGIHINIYNMLHLFAPVSRLALSANMNSIQLAVNRFHPGATRATVVCNSC